MTSVLVIGPTEFADGSQAEAPPWVASPLKEEEPGKDPIASSPLGVRRAIARRLAALYVAEVVMESHPKANSESCGRSIDWVVREEGMETSNPRPDDRER